MRTKYFTYAIFAIAALVGGAFGFEKKVEKIRPITAEDIFGKSRKTGYFRMKKNKSVVVARDFKTESGKVIVTWRKGDKVTVVTNALRSLVGKKQDNPIHAELKTLKEEHEKLKEEHEREKEEHERVKEELAAEKKKNKDKGK